MEKQVGIWIDSKKAIIVSLVGQKEEKITEIDSEVENSVYHNKEGNKGTFSGSHHGDSETKFDNRKKEEMNYYLKSVMNYIKKSDYLYIFGPGETKTKLEQKIHDDKSLEKINLKAVETSDNMTLNEIVAKVKDFYNPLQRKINLAHRL
jgi:stalled ribosome rescue protein Dom34